MGMTEQWVVACYNQLGESEGWFTTGGTLSYYSTKALRFSSKQAADNRIVRLEATWPCQYLWCAERAPKYDIDVRTGARLDTTNEQAVESALTQSTRPTGQQGETMPVVKKTTKKATAVKPVPKMKLRTTAKAKASKADIAASNGTSRQRRTCLCGCGALSSNLFLRGHVKSYGMKLRKVKAGELKPEKAFGKQIATALGPWKPTRGGGFVPTVTSTDKLRELVS